MCLLFFPLQGLYSALVLIHVTCVILLFSPDGLTEFLFWWDCTWCGTPVFWPCSMWSDLTALWPEWCNFSAVCCWGADGAAWGGVPPRQHTAHDVLWSHRECSCQHTARWSRQRLNDVKLGPRYSEDGHGQMTLSQTAKFLLRRRAVILASVGLLGLRFCFGETGILDIIKKQDCWSRGNVLQ